MTRLLLITFAAFALFARQSAAQVRFDDVDDVLYCSAHDAALALNFTNHISVSFWLKKNAGLDAADEYMGKGRLVSGGVSHWQIRDDSSGGLDFYFASPNSTFHIYSTTPTYPATNVWSHYAFKFTFGSAASAQWWVNGERVAGAWIAGTGNAIGLTNAEPFQLGRTYAGSHFPGELQEVAIWNDLLGDDEVKSLACSRLMDMPLQIRPRTLRFFEPLRGRFPPFTAMSGSNALESVVFVDGTRYRVPLTPQNSPQQRANEILSVP